MRTLDAELTRLGKEHRFYSYPGADHAFMNRYMPQRHHRTSAELAWARTREFLAEQLQPAPLSADLVILALWESARHSPRKRESGQRRVITA